MPEENQSPSPSISPTLEKPKRNWKKILLILLILGISVSLIGIGIYFIGTGDFQVPSSQKQATPPSKTNNQIPLVFAFSKEVKADSRLNEDVLGFDKATDIWIYDKGKIKQLTDTGGLAGKYKLSEDKKTLYYIKNDVVLDENGSDYFRGSELIQKNIINSQEKILVPKITIEDVHKASILDFDLSHDGTKIVYTRDVLWVLDLKTNETTKLAEITHLSKEPFSGGSYDDVDWSPSDKYIASSWTGYERLGYELIDVNTKKITTLEPGGFPPLSAFSDFVTDDKGIFVNNNSNEERITIKDLDNLKKEVIFKGFGGTWEEGPFTDLFVLKYIASEDRIYMIQKTTILNKPEGTGSFFQNKIVYLDRKAGKITDLTKQFGKDVTINNLSVTSDGKYILFNVGDDIWLYEAEKKKSRMLVKNAFDPVVPESK